MLQPQLELDPSSRDAWTTCPVCYWPWAVWPWLSWLSVYEKHGPPAWVRTMSGACSGEWVKWWLVFRTMDANVWLLNYVLLSLLDLYYLYYESANNDPDTTRCLVWLNRREFQFQRSCTWIHLWLLCDVELKVLRGWVGMGWVRFTVVNSWCNEVWN